MNFVKDDKNERVVSESEAFVPELQLTVGQALPIAANGGRSYLSRDVNGDAGTEAATEDALQQIATGEGQLTLDLIENAPPGPIHTKWGEGFRRYAECMKYIESAEISVPEGGVALPLKYTIYEAPSYSIVPSNALWKDPSRKLDAAALAKDERDNAKRSLYFPQVLKDARRISEYHNGLDPRSAECMDRLGLSLAHCESECENFYDSEEVRRIFYPEMEKLLLEFFPDAVDALVYNLSLIHI